MTSEKQMILSALYVPPGNAMGSWLHPDAPSHASRSIDFAIEMAQLCERGRFDLFFVADTPATRTDFLEVWSKSPIYQNILEPLTLLTAVACSTTHIGVGGTVSTSFFEPYNIARQFASLDFISRGRAAWNVVTSANDYAARNFGLAKLPPHDRRYDKAREAVQLVKQYWDTWEDDAFVEDKENAVNFLPEKFHPVDFEGEFFSAQGGLNLARPPQGHPVILEAGASDPGKELAAQTAEVVFGTGSSLEKAQAFYEDLKGRLPRYGRTADDLKILSGFTPVVGETKEEAAAKKRHYDDLVPIESLIMLLNNDLETDLLDLPFDEKVPLDRIPESSNHHQVYFEEIAEMIRSQKYTLREIARRYNRSTSTFYGSAEEIADHMQSWVEAGGGDGFMVGFTHMPTEVRDFVTKVVPVLQRRGALRAEYTGSTLREHLGLKRPKNVHVR